MSSRSQKGGRNRTGNPIFGRSATRKRMEEVMELGKAQMTGEEGVLSQTCFWCRNALLLPRLSSSSSLASSGADGFPFSHFSRHFTSIYH